jgi:toxin ParE1/3/4
MSRAIVETDEAIKDAIDIADYIAVQRNLDASDAFLAAVKEGYRLLAMMPGAGSLRDYGDPELSGMRVWPVPRFRNYLIFYLATQEQVRILRVLHGAQNLEAIFAPPEE